MNDAQKMTIIDETNEAVSEAIDTEGLTPEESLAIAEEIQDHCRVRIDGLKEDMA